MTIRYHVQGYFDDGKNEAPGYEVDQKDLPSVVMEELANDYGDPFGVGFKLIIERTQ